MFREFSSDHHRVKTNLSSSPNLFVQISAAEMGDELTSLLAIFKKVEESGGQAILSVTTKSGVTKTKLELVSPPGWQKLAR